MSDIDPNESDEVTIADSAGVNKLTVNADGTTNVTSYPYFLVKSLRYFGTNIEFNVASTGEQNVLLIRNPSGSGKNLYLNRVICGVLGNATRYRVRIYQKPVVTAAGTSVTPFSNLVSGSPPTSAMTAYTGPTTSSLGVRMRTYSIDGTSSLTDSFDFGLDLNPGYDLLVTGEFDATNKVLAISLQWGEI